MVIKLFFLSLLSFFGLHGRDITAKTRPHDVKYYIDYFFSGWMPTVITLGGIATHCIIKRTPVDVISTCKHMKKVTVSNFNFMTASIAFCATCILYSYYKPRIDETIDNVRRKGSVW